MKNVCHVWLWFEWLIKSFLTISQYNTILYYCNPIACITTVAATSPHVSLSTQDSRKTKETPLKHWYKAITPCPPLTSFSRPNRPTAPLLLPSPANIYFILGSACKGPLKICKSKLLVSQGQLWELGALRLQICGGAGQQQVPVSIT